MVVNSLSLVCLFSGNIFVALGLILRFFPPKKINWLYGYRTRFSMQNQETWQQANRYSAQLLWQMGLVMMVLGIVAFPLPQSPFTGTFAGIHLFDLLVFGMFSRLFIAAGTAAGLFSSFFSQVF